ncbi:hypothetical protein PENTCL1PPCAC_10308, partial [Pristionchus entomophagus]
TRVGGKQDLLHRLCTGGPRWANAHHVYDWTTNEWELECPHRDRDNYMAVQSIGSKIFVAGGADEEHNPLARAASCDLSTETPVWTILQPMLKPRIHPSSCVLNGKLYVIGGYYDCYAPGHLVGEYYNPDTNSWSAIASMSVQSPCFSYRLEWTNLPRGRLRAGRTQAQFRREVRPYD